MKLSASLAGVGAAVIFAFAAQTAQAQTCPVGDGGGVTMPIEVTDPGLEPCQPSGGDVELITTVQTANNTSYAVQTEVPGGYDYLEVGEVVEVEIEFDDVMAALKANEQEAVVLAAAIGVRPDVVGLKSGVMAVANTARSSAKLTEAEYRAVATHMFVSMQSGGRATGRSDPAPNSLISRIEATGQAIGRAWNSFTSSLPNRIDLGMSHTTYHSNGQKKSEFRMTARADRQP